MTPPHWATLGIRRIMILITITVPTTNHLWDLTNWENWK